MIRYLVVWIVLCAWCIITIDNEYNPKKAVDFNAETQSGAEIFFNVTSVLVLPVPMLPVSNWVLELITGNTSTLATFLSETAAPLCESLRPCVKKERIQLPNFG